jgi:fibronectin type 3 domain-containing protein
MMKGNARSLTKAWIMAAMGVVLAGGVTMEAAERVRPLAKSGTRAVPREAMKGRVQGVAVDPTMLSEAGFEVTLFPGQTFRVERDGTTALPGGDRVWNGRVVGEPLSRVTFASRRGVVSGVIDRAMTSGNELYEIQPQAKGGYVAIQHRESQGSVMGTDTIAVEGGAQRRATPVLDEGDCGVRVVDVMLLYTPASRVRYGVAGIEAKILQAVADANASMANSQIPMRFSLVHLGEVAYVETGSMGGALAALQRKTDGLMDEVHALRDQVGADLVTLVNEDTSSCGLSYLMSVPSAGFEANAFSVVYSGCLASLSLIHEWGHNLGCHHDRPDAAGPTSYPFAYGWRQCSTNSPMFRTVMAYACGSAIRINYFSNPRLSYAGIPLGVDEALDPENAADNARAIGLNGLIVAGFRNVPGQTVPAAPTALGIAQATATGVTLSWVRGDLSAVHHVVERSEEGGAWVLVAILGADAVGYVDSEVTVGNEYAYRVRGVNGAGLSIGSNEVSVVVPEPVPVPAAPTGLQVALGVGSVRVTWTDVSSAETEYRLERSVNGGAWALCAALGANVTSHVDANVSAGSTYAYRVIALNASGASPASNVGIVTVPVAVPSAPTGLSGIAVSRRQINLSWTDTSANETGFKVERSTNGSKWTQVGTVGANIRSYAATGLSSNTTYYFRVRAYNASGNSAYTPVVVVKTLRSWR